MHMCLSDFKPSSEEKKAINILQEEVYMYMFQKQVSITRPDGCVFLNIKEYFKAHRTTTTERSTVTYLRVPDAVSDSKDTMMEVLQDLHRKFIINQRKQHLLVEGDAKLYDILQSLKYEYGSELEWLIVFPGDWHTLKNFQHALMKVYFHAGLKDLAKSSGYPVAAIEACSRFKRTHSFILEVWEALLRVFL